jgi:hypothetical protein
LIVANLGIICACLIVIKQVVKRYILSVFSKKPGRSRGYGYWAGSSSAARDVNKSSNHNPPRFRNRRHSHFQLEDTLEADFISLDVYGCNTENAGGVWSGEESFQMHTLVHGDAPEDGSNSDEKHIVLTATTERG